MNMATYPRELAARQPSAIAPMAAGGAVYAYGTVQARFPSLSVEKEFFQSIEDSRLADKDDYDNIANATDLKRLNELINAKNSLYEVLSKPENRYIAREMCWLLQSRRNQTLYLLDTANDARLDELVNLLRVDGNNKKCGAVAVGRLQALASVWACNGIDAPAVELLSLAPVDLDKFCQSLQNQKNGIDPAKCAAIATPLLTLTDNPGRSDEQRALNYALLNYPRLYELVYTQTHGGGKDCCGQAGGGGWRLDGLRTEPAPGNGRQVRLNLSFVGTSQAGTRDLWYCVIDVAGHYPFVAEELTQTVSLG